MADAAAATMVVLMLNPQLDHQLFTRRQSEKFKQFLAWHREWVPLPEGADDPE